jgi:hypothetical protein
VDISPCLRTVSFFWKPYCPVLSATPTVMLYFHRLYKLIAFISIDIYCVSMPNSLSSCDVGTDFLIFLLLLPLPFSLVIAFAAAASCDSCDATARVGWRTRPGRQGSGLELLVSGSVALSELSVELLSGDELLGVLDWAASKVLGWVSNTSCVWPWLWPWLSRWLFSDHLGGLHLILVMVSLSTPVLLCLVLFLLLCCFSSCYCTLPTGGKGLEVRLFQRLWKHCW